VYVPRGVSVELPLQSLTFADLDGLAVFPHTLLVLDEGAELTFIDRYVSPNLERALSDAVVEIFAGPASRLRYIGLQESGAVKERSRAIYSGTVVIRKGAHKCDAYQTNRNILLSDRAKADSIPNLEILSNDPVRCGHAASIGPVEEEALFYIQSRGIPFEEAE